MGAKAVVVKGGHLEGPATDILYDGEQFRAFTSQRIKTTNNHGSPNVPHALQQVRSYEWL